MTLMFVTRQTRRLGFVYAIATLLFDIVLGSHAVGQTPRRMEAKTITLGIVSPIDQKEVEEHFRGFRALCGKKAFLRAGDRGKDHCNSDAVSAL